MIVYVVTRPAPKDILGLVSIDQSDFLIGVDGAIEDLIRQHIRIDLAVGDFDSLLDQSMLKDLKVDRLNVCKDITDTAHALKVAAAMNPVKIHLLGGFKGKRADHFYANMALFDHYPQLIIQDDHNIASLLSIGNHHLRSEDYVSIFPYPRAVVTLRGFKYPLTDYRMEPYDTIGISNEITLDEGIITVTEGRVLVIRSNEK